MSQCCFLSSSFFQLPLNTFISYLLLNSRLDVKKIYFHRKFHQVESTELCARTDDYLKVGTSGDAGSPLIFHKGNMNILIGIASSKSSTSQIGPTVFTRVSSFKKWIDESKEEQSVTGMNGSMA